MGKQVFVNTCYLQSFMKTNTCRRGKKKLDCITSLDIQYLKKNKKNYNMKYHVILGRFKWLINVSPSLEGIRYPRSVYVLSFVCFFLLLLLFLYSLEKQFGWFLTHISRLHI